MLRRKLDEDRVAATMTQQRLVRFDAHDTAIHRNLVLRKFPFVQHIGDRARQCVRRRRIEQAYMLRPDSECGRLWRRNRVSYIQGAQVSAEGTSGNLSFEKGRNTDKASHVASRWALE